MGYERGRLRPVRRAQAIAVILALLAMPIVLLADGWAECSEECTRMCCPVHRHHPPQKHNSNVGSQDEDLVCHHQSGGHMMICQMRADRFSSLSSPIAPIPPTLLPAVSRLAGPEDQFGYRSNFPQAALSGFISPPFVPPRA